MNFIIDPNNLNKISIHSFEGKKLLKRYITYYQSGGTNLLKQATRNRAALNASSKAVSNLTLKRLPTPKNIKNATMPDTPVTYKEKNSSSEVESPGRTEIIPCNKKTFCETRDIVCKTNYKGEKGTRLCGVLIKSNWPESLSKYFDSSKTYDDLPISAVFYEKEDSNKLKELDTLVKSIKHVDSRFEPDKKLSRGAYGVIYTYDDPNTNEKNAIKIIKANEDLTPLYFDESGKEGAEIEDETEGVIYDLEHLWNIKRNFNIGADTHYNMFEIKFPNGNIMKRSISLMNDFNKNNDRNEVDIAGMHKTSIQSSLQEAVLLHKLSQITVGNNADNTLRTVSPKIDNVYVYMNGGKECYVGYTMGLGKGSLDGDLVNINNNISGGRNLNKDQLHIVNTMQDQIYDIMAAQYDAGYINLDIKPPNLLVNIDNNIQIIDSGATDFTHDVNEVLVDVNDSDLKRELIIFAQQLIITLNILQYKPALFQAHKFKILPNSIKKLKELGITPDEAADYLITIKDDIQFSYSYMLNYYGNAESVGSKQDNAKYVKSSTKYVFTKYDQLS